MAARMFRAVSALLFLAALVSGVPVEAQEMQKLYLVPIEEVNGGQYRGPEYFEWRNDQNGPSIPGPWAMMDYGFTPFGLLLAKDISQADHDALVLHSDVFAFPDDLDTAVPPNSLDAFFEAIHLPTDWMTPATTYREFLRQVAGIFLFNQRYGGIAAADTGEWRSIFDTATLDSRLNEMTAQEQAWFLATVESMGYDPDLVPTNARLRQLVKAAGDYWQGQPIYLGGVEL